MTEYNIKGTYEPGSLDEVVGAIEGCQEQRWHEKPLPPLIKDNFIRAAVNFIVGASVTMVGLSFGNNYTLEGILGGTLGTTAVTIPLDYFIIYKRNIKRALTVSPSVFAGLNVGIYLAMYLSK